jgi:hypothetical protein
VGRRKIVGYVSNYKCFKNNTCSDKELKAIGSNVGKAIRKELPEYFHPIGCLIRLVVKKKVDLVELY